MYTEDTQRSRGSIQISEVSFLASQIIPKLHVMHFSDFPSHESHNTEMGILSLSLSIRRAIELLGKGRSSVIGHLVGIQRVTDAIPDISPLSPCVEGDVKSP